MRVRVIEVSDPVHEDRTESIVYTTPGTSPGIEREIPIPGYYIPVKVEDIHNRREYQIEISIKKLNPGWQRTSRKRRREFNRNKFPRIKQVLEANHITLDVEQTGRSMTRVTAMGQHRRMNNRCPILEPNEDSYENLRRI